MYKSITLEKFERLDFCSLKKGEFENIKIEIEKNIHRQNEGIKDGKDYFGIYMQSYSSELDGILNVCSLLGVSVRINREREENEQKNNSCSNTSNQ